jgi:DNA-binding XRE family transcriptional regulator
MEKQKQKKKEKKLKLKFRNKIRQYRESRGIELKTLAIALNKSLSAVYQMEKFEHFPRGGTREKLLKFFNCKFEDLFYEIEC